MKKNKIAKRLSLRAKFKSTSLVEVVIMDDIGNIQIELIPVTIKFSEPKDTEDTPLKVGEGKEIPADVEEGR